MINHYIYSRCGFLWRKIRVKSWRWDIPEEGKLDGIIHQEIGIFNSMKEAKLAVKLLS